MRTPIGFTHVLVATIAVALVGCGGSAPDAPLGSQAAGGSAGAGGVTSATSGGAGTGGSAGAGGVASATSGSAGTGGSGGTTSAPGPDATAAPPVRRVPTGLVILFASGESTSGGVGNSYRSSTIYVLSDGSVWRDTRGTAPAGDAATAPPIPDSLAKIGFVGAQVGTVDPTTLANKYAQLDLARRGSLIFGGGVVDGGYWSSGTLYDDAGTSGNGVRLHSDNYINTSAEARALASWLASLGGGPDHFLRTYRCVGSPCAGAPGCSAGEVPMTLTTDLATDCLDSCGNAGLCNVVDSCSACGARICVVDRTGQPYCSQPGQYETACTGTYNCECAGDEICAGGKADCRGSMATGFTCAAP